jgi:phosphopantetheinyl transferase
MAREDDKWVSERFEATTREWAAPAFVDRLLFAPISSDRESAARCAAVLSDVELRRANGFLTERDRNHFIQRRAFRRYCGSVALGSLNQPSQIVFEETENGRPWLRDRPDLWFSFSSCRNGFIGTWSSTYAVGVDLEDRSTDVEATELAQTYFTGSEARAVEKGGLGGVQMFLQLWCLKEAALKSIGEGLPFGLDAFEFQLNGRLRVVNVPEGHGCPENFSAHLFNRTEVYGALVSRQLSKLD